MAIYLFEPKSLRQRFYPLSRNKNVTDLPIGGSDIKTWWELQNKTTVHILTEYFLQKTVPAFIEPGEWLIVGSTFPGRLELIFEHIAEDGSGYMLAASKKNVADEVLAVRIKEQISTEAVRSCFYNNSNANANTALMELLKSQNIAWKIPDNYNLINTPEKLLESQKAGIAASVDFVVQKMNAGLAKPATLDAHNQVKGQHPVILEEGAEISMSFLNTEEGPIYIGKGARVMEGSMIRGPLYLGAFSTIKMGTRIYGPVITGPSCTLGGEIKNCIFQEGSNKGHDGYLGDSIIGAWCNFGAGSGGSNVKNTAGDISLYDYNQEGYRCVGKKFGALVGDYTRLGVGTQLNAGSSIGVCCSLVGQQTAPAIVSDFTWRMGSVMDEYQFDKATDHIRKWKEFKGQKLTDREIQILLHIFDQPRLQG